MLRILPAWRSPKLWFQTPWSCSIKSVSKDVPKMNECKNLWVQADTVTARPSTESHRRPRGMERTQTVISKLLWVVDPISPKRMFEYVTLALAWSFSTSLGTPEVVAHGPRC